MESAVKSVQKKIKVKWPVTVNAGANLIEGVTRNITDAGMLILSKEPLRMDKQYQITVRLPNYLNRILTCRVIWSNLYGIDPQNDIYAMGYCFLKASGKDRVFLTNVMADYRPN